MPRFPNTVKHDGHTFWLTNLAISEAELRTTLEILDAYGLDHYIQEHPDIDTTEWPDRPNHRTTVYAIYVPAAKHTPNIHRKLKTPSYGDR